MYDRYARIELRTLENGMRVYVLHEPQRSFVKIDLVVEVGGTHEPYSFPGMAHFTEHMVCRNTGLTVSELDEYFNSEGGYFSAATTENYTQFGFSAPLSSVKLPSFLTLLYQSCFEELSTEAIEEERKVILQEFHTRFPTDKHIAFREKMHSTLYPDSPLSRGIPVIGTKHALQSITASDVLLFHTKNYTSANAFIVCVGGLSADIVVEKLSSAGFGLLSKVERPIQPDTWFPKNPRLLSLEEDFSNGEKSNASLTVLVNVNGLSSLAPVINQMFNRHLTEELRSKRSLVYEVNASVGAQYPFLTVAYGGNDFKYEHVKEVGCILDDVIENLKRKKDLFTMIRRGQLLSYEMTDETLGQVSEQVIQDITRFGSVKTMAEARRETEAICFEDVLAVLEQITEERCLVVTEYN
jgi:predicted Zn-dependent peptidase